MMTRFIVVPVAVLSLVACATGRSDMPQHALNLPDDLPTTDTRPDGTVKGSFTSALGLECVRVAAATGNLIACKHTEGWLVVEDHTPKSTNAR